MAYMQLALEEAPRSEWSGPKTVTAGKRVSTVVRYPAFQSAGMNPSRQDIVRDDEARNIEGSPANLPDAFEPSGRITQHAYANDLPFYLQAGGWNATITPGVSGTNEVQSLVTTGVPTGGTFTLTFEGQTTGPIPYNATAAQVAAALNALSNVTTGGVTCSGGPLPGAITITFVGRLVASRNTGAITATSTGLTGGTTPTAVPSTTTPGVAGAVLDPDGLTVPTGCSRIAFLKRTGSLDSKTLQMILGYTEISQFFIANGVGVSNITLNAAGDLGVDLMGLYMARLTSDPGLSPSLDAITLNPFRRADLSLTWLAGSSETDDFTLALPNPLERHKTFATQRSLFSDRMIYADTKIIPTGGIPKWALGSADFDAYMSGATFNALARFVSDSLIGATQYPFALFIEMPACQLTGGTLDDLGNKRKYGANYEFKATVDPGTGYDMKITVVCSITALETYV